VVVWQIYRLRAYFIGALWTSRTRSVVNRPAGCNPAQLERNLRRKLQNARRIAARPHEEIRGRGEYTRSRVERILPAIEIIEIRAVGDVESLADQSKLHPLAVQRN